MTGFNSKAEADRLGYVATQIKRKSDGSILHMNPDETYSFLDSKMYKPFKYDLDVLLNSKFEVLGWAKKRYSEMMMELSVINFIDDVLYSIIDSDEGFKSIFDYLIMRLDNWDWPDAKRYKFKWHYPPYEDPINISSTYSNDKTLTVYMYLNNIPLDKYPISLDSLKRDFKINNIIDEDYLFNSENKLLIAHPTNHGPNVWSIPKGRIDANETSEYEVTVRELWEETNVDLKKFGSKIESVVPLDYVRYRNTNKYLRGFFVKVNDSFVEHELKCHSWVYRDGEAVFHEMDAFKWVLLEEAIPVLNEFQNKNIELCQDLITKKQKS